jgi:hypothetical protein
LARVLRSVFVEDTLQIRRAPRLQQRHAKQHADLCGFNLTAATNPNLSSSTSTLRPTRPVVTREARGGARLRQRACSVNPVVHDDEDTLSGRILVRRYGHGVEEVERAAG